jgi:hypothetical protein
LQLVRFLEWEGLRVEILVQERGESFVSTWPPVLVPS